MFSFVSGLYFRGKATYAAAFGRPPPQLSGGLVISPGEGLRFLHEPVTLERLRGWAEVPIDEANRRFTAPLIEHAGALERAYGGNTRFVLLGSVASDKYVVPLTRVFGDHLLFPSEFVGRGDMSRGAMLLRAARAGEELAYIPVEGTRRQGPRMAPRPRRAARTAPAGLEVAILIGLPGAGKTTYAGRLASTHVHVGGDNPGKPRRSWRQQEGLILEALRGGRSVVVDNTNASLAERARLIALARTQGARVVGYFFDSPLSACLARNGARPAGERVPNAGVFAIAKRLVRPAVEEGFDQLHILGATASAAEAG